VGIAIAIIVIFLVAAATLLLTARRRATTGGLSRETRRRDVGASSTATTPETSTSTDLELQGRERADETRARAGGEVAERESGAVSRWEPVDEEELGVTRRQFLNRGVLASVGFAVSVFGAGVLAFLWPTRSGGFGGKVAAGNIDDILGSIGDTRKPFYVPLARTYLQPYPKDDLAKAEKVYPPVVVKGIEDGGIVALYQKCVHLGCRVPWCDTSQWFECPCHGSKYNRVGEKRDGPAPRGLDHWPVLIEGGKVTIDTSGTPITGPPIGTDTTGQKPEGPHCI
jgi:cytochrome b6-f complex iron-sulfur subunit